MLHPNIHAPWSVWSECAALHVAVAYSNPFRWRSRRELMNNFRTHMGNTPNVVLHVGELAYGDRPFEVTEETRKGDVQFRTSAELFHKENILNEVIKTFPPDWKYGAYVDADFTFTRHDWALETIHKLQHSPWVQPFSTYAYTGKSELGLSTPGAAQKSFAATYIENGYRLPEGVHYEAGWDERRVVSAAATANPKDWVSVGATGGAWAFTRDAFDKVGGLLDVCILGHGDWFMAFGLVSQPTRGTIAASKFSQRYTDAIAGWQVKADTAAANIGFVDQFILHHYHGSMQRRGYSTRDQILVKYQFDPLLDMRKNWQGIYELTGNKPALRDAIRAYFVQRDEDN